MNLNCLEQEDRFPGGSDSKESACNAGDLGLILEFGISPQKGMVTHSSIPAWRIPWTVEPGRLQSSFLVIGRYLMMVCGRHQKTVKFMLKIYQWDRGGIQLLGSMLCLNPGNQCLFEFSLLSLYLQQFLNLSKNRYWV